MKRTRFNLIPDLALKSNLHKALQLSRETYERQRYNTPMFVMFETLKAFQRHNAFGLSASLSFYAMFALIPMVLLMFFLLSHWVFSSDYAIIKLAIVTSNLVPQLSNSIMVEVYNASKHRAAWGALGVFVLLWTVTPLAGAMRSAFYNIAALIEPPSFFRRKVKDVIAIIGMLLLFFLFTFAGLALENVVTFLGENIAALQSSSVAIMTSLLMTTLLIAALYFAFFPVKLHFRHILIGALFTAVLWLLMRPAFTVFFSMNASYGAIFGGMKNLFISITWLYFNFAVFLLGTELIATLRKKEVLLLKGLFNEEIENSSQLPLHYIEKLMQRYGHTYQQGEYIFKRGEAIGNLYYLVSGQIQLMKEDESLRRLGPGDYFGELAMLSNTPAIADALVVSDHAAVISMHSDNIEILLLDEPKVAMRFLRQMADRLQKRFA
ncbi:MAG: YihY family inner membrane protein [Betaproteobacteria bacterium]|nr:YihY family inner membrane protein [Betaproteobacteria bacterium]